MYRKVLLGGVTAAAIVGAGGTAIALTGSDSLTPTPTPSTSNAKPGPGHKNADHKKGKHGMAGKLGRLAHGEFVTKGKDGKFVTHDLINGTVSAVSSTSITVVAADKKIETFSVTKDTKVRERTITAKADKPKTKADKSKQKKKKKASESSISKIATGDRVLVAGTGTTTMTAQHILEIKGTK